MNAAFSKDILSAIEESITEQDLAGFTAAAKAQGVTLDGYLSAWAENITRKLRGIKPH
jgi:argininosuccinate lyase